MIELDSACLKQIQRIELEMLIEVDRICRKCGIRYNIIAGTLIGAVRNAGFIPWDDDADIAMLRSEYEKFRKACKTELDKRRFYFQDHRNTRGYRWGYGKLRRKGTLFLRENQEHMPYGQEIFIDIFPQDGVPDNYLLRCLHNFHCFCIRKILWSAVGRFSDASRWKRILYSMLYKIPDRLVFRHYHKFIIKSNKKKTKLVRTLMFPTPNRVYGYERRWFAASAPIEFEHQVLQGIKHYDEYLRFTYGDYRQLPPVDQRKIHPVSKIQLAEPNL